MDKFKIIAFFLMLGVTCTPVTSTYGIYQPQFFRFPPMQQPYTPYAYYDSYRINTGIKPFPAATYPNGYPNYPVYSYTPVYDYRYPPVQFYIGGRPVYPLPPPQIPGPEDPSPKDKSKKDKKNKKDDKEDKEDPDKDTENGDEDEDDKIEKLDKNDEKKKNKNDKKPKKPEEDKKKPEDKKKSEENSTERNEDSVTVDALE
ncbi:myelin transcription factor 1-like protein [Leptopilina boulardi]|uniref:myelin transcription factor 1-like protein n=1 Tax=Leptopilina boulardi TaxID=63433 RepID=UPI0021F62C0D|nr:myelin transcription factor 1-like protein [Leptopilina boulardi]